MLLCQSLTCTEMTLWTTAGRGTWSRTTVPVSPSTSIRTSPERRSLPPIDWWYESSLILSRRISRFLPRQHPCAAHHTYGRHDKVRRHAAHVAGAEPEHADTEDACQHVEDSDRDTRESRDDADGKADGCHEGHQWPSEERPMRAELGNDLLAVAGQPHRETHQPSLSAMPPALRSTLPSAPTEW